MKKLLLTLDLDALRGFVMGIECGSFTHAATRLCRSTSALSAQLKKLERQCETELVVKKGRHLVLTREGEILMSYASRMLALNDEAQRALKGEELIGEIRFGMPEDFGESLMPNILGEFSNHHPLLLITARVDRNQALINAFDDNKLDMALLWQHQNKSLDSKIIRQFQLEWIQHKSLDVAALLASGQPLPLVVFESPCIMRSRALDCLNRAGIAWRIVFVSQSLSGIWSAVQAGLGITLRTHLGMPDSLCLIGGLLPPPGSLEIILEKRNKKNERAQVMLERLIEESILGVR